MQTESSGHNPGPKGSVIFQSFPWRVAGEGFLQASCLGTIPAPSLPSSSASLTFPFILGLKRIRQESHYRRGFFAELSEVTHPNPKAVLIP